MGTAPVWPPPSPPWTSTASTPHSATFSAWRLAPMDGTTTTPASLSLAIRSWFGARAKEPTFTPLSISRSMRRAASGASARRLTPKGASVAALTSSMADESWA